MSFVLEHMNVFAFVLAGVLGAIVGSFLNVVILRLRSGVSFVRGSSQCLACVARLRWFELIPIFSFLMQRGRCMSCRVKLSYQYPLVELSTAIMFMVVLERSGALAWPTVHALVLFLLALVFWSVALVIAGYDARHKIIPDELSLILGGAGLVVAFLDPTSPFALSIASGLGGAAFFAGLWAVSKGKWMGLGDAKLAFGLGTFLGWPLVILGNLFGFWIGAIWGIFFLLTGAYSRKSELPFGPFLIFGAFLAYLAGEGIWDWYISFIGL